MPVFEYRGVGPSGRKVKGVIDADNAQAARSRLRKEGVYLTDLNIGRGEALPGGSQNQRARGGSVRGQDVAIMMRQLATLLAAGIPLVESLSALIDQTESLRLKRVISDVRERVNEGSSLADAMRAHPKIYPAIFSNMVMAGEASGTLDIVLERLADFSEGQMKLRNKILQVMLYPAIMIVIGLAVMLILFTFVIPKVTSIYESINATLPTPTIILIKTSEITVTYWYFLPIGLGLFVYILRAYMAREKGRFVVHRFLLRLPLMGNILRMLAVSRVTRTLGTLVSSGVPLLTALDIVKNVVNNVVIRRVVVDARREISEGESIHAPLKKSGEFPPMVTHMIAVGERTGALDKMLLKVSDVYDDQVDSRIVAMTSLLEPVMIVVMAVAVGFIVMAVLLPFGETSDLSERAISLALMYLIGINRVINPAPKGNSAVMSDGIGEDLASRIGMILMTLPS